MEDHKSRLEGFIIAGLLATIVWAPLPLGSNRDWSAALLIILISFLALLWGYHLFRSPDSDKKLKLPGLAMLGLLSLTQLWVSIQWLFGLTANPGASFQYFMLGIGYTFLFLMMISLFNTRKRLTLLLGVLVASGAFQAFWGASMVLSGVEWLFGVPKEHYLGKATGTFVNRNHLAGYLEMTIGLGIGLMLALRDGKSFRWRNVIDLLLGPKTKLRLALVIMVIGLVMTQSRMGNAGFFASLLIVGAIFILLTKEHRLRNSLLLVSFIIIDMIVISQYFGLERLKDRLVNTEVSVTQEAGGKLVFDINDLRGLAFTNSIPMAQEKSFIGHGAGSYEVVFMGHAGPNFGGHFDHAHNDYIQFWAEYGIIGSLPLVLFTLIALYQAFRALSNKESHFRSGVGFGAAMAMIAIIIHSFSDFNLQIPANAMTFVVVAAIAVLANTHRSRVRSS
ncbi:O-antigen ligase family protein [Thiosulfativibrio zosterae]|uniref:Polymerase n=1 Tax=Thiosulfativibrio zosterae TaxID=2675053 RepID=A0A6F8PQV1_9GAMM|nr:O-antigen ligase family protein [Thiosulfativibrio zosterae]BBP44503.1 polymerase [Thiosulfativibrio zosterae]